MKSNLLVVFLVRHTFQLEVASDITFSIGVRQVGLDVCVKILDFRSNRSRVIKPDHFMMDDERRQTLKSRDQQDRHSNLFSLTLSKKYSSISVFQGSTSNCDWS